MKKILFRADAAPSIGIGDLVSLIHLSAYFAAKNWDVHFMIREYDAGLELARTHALNNLITIAADISVRDEVQAINHYCREQKIDLLFFEITERPLAKYTGLLPHIKKICVSFDGSILNDMQVVIDWDVAAKNFFTPAQHPHTIFLLGPEYVILPQHFYTDKRIEQRRYSSSVKNIAIAMGGADEFNLTGEIAETLIKQMPECHLNIIIGSGYMHKEHLQKNLASQGGQWSIKQNISTMLEEYLASDVVIAAGGLTSSELMASHTPAILLATHEHQIARCKYFAEQGWATYIGFRNLALEALKKALTAIKIPEHWPQFNTQKIVKVCHELIQV